jgi:hypothetical protein
LRSTLTRAPALRGGDRRLRGGGGLRAEGRRDPGDVEPGGAGHDLVPLHRVGGDVADGRLRAIVDDRPGPLAGAGLGEINPDAMAGANDVRGVDALGAQCPHAGIADRVRREARDVAAVQAELREAGGDVGLAAAEGRRQHGRLKKP